MKRALFGKIRYKDERLGQDGEFLVNRLGPRHVSLFLDQNVLGIAGVGGDCEVGFKDNRIQELIQSLTDTVQKAETGDPIRWQSVDSIAYSWCDQDDEGDPPGKVLLEACRGTVRLTIQPSPRQEEHDYVATMSLKAFQELVQSVITVIKAG